MATVQESVSRALFRCLREMDNEASTPINGSSTGLWWYAGYARPNAKKAKNEPCWTCRLSQLLPNHGFETASPFRYPGKKTKCDLVLDVGQGSRFWIEVKPAYKDWWYERGSLSVFRSYLFYPLLPDLLPRTHSAALDLERLAQLELSNAAYIGLLLVGFDTPQCDIDPDLDEFAQLTGVGQLPWGIYRSNWDDPYRAGHRIRLWFASRPV